MNGQQPDLYLIRREEEYKKLRKLIELQHEALGELVGATILVDEALDAYECFKKEGE